MLFLILSCTGSDDSGESSVEDSAVVADSAPSCFVEDGNEIALPQRLLTPLCQNSTGIDIFVGSGVGYLSMPGWDCGGTGATVEVVAYPSLETVLSHEFADWEGGLAGGTLFVQPSGTEGMIWGAIGESGKMNLWGIDLLTGVRTFTIEDAYATNLYPSAAGTLMGWSSWDRVDEPAFSVYDVGALPANPSRADAIAVHSDTANSRLYYSTFIPDTNGDGLDDLLSLAWMGPTSTGVLLVDHADAITDQGYLNGRPVPGSFGRAIPAPDWDGDGLPDIAVYDNDNQNTEFFVHRGTDAVLLVSYYRDPIPEHSWDTPFGFGAQMVDGLLEEGQQAILIEDRDTPNGDRIRVLLPGSCGSEAMTETPYLLRDPLTIEYMPFLAGGDLMVQMLTNNEILLSSNQF